MPAPQEADDRPAPAVPEAVRKLQARIEAFAAARRESTGGWAPVLPGDAQDLCDIFHEIVRLKWAADPDGDRPIEVEIVDRTIYESMPFVPVRYARADADDGSDFAAQMRDRMGNLRAAWGALNDYVRGYESQMRPPGRAYDQGDA